jgi:capsular polysaccharide biosynthesis protein
MSIQDFIRILARGWWIIILITGLFLAGAYEYSHKEHRIYRATATVFAHPSKVVVSAGDYSNDLGLLSYGSLSQTFASLAQSRSMLAKAAAALRIAPDAASQYSATASLLPQTTAMELSVDGPDKDVVTKLANRLSSDVSAATTHYFHIFSLTTLDAAVAPSTLIQPLTSRNLLYGGLAGLIVGFVLAALFYYLPEVVGSARAPGRTAVLALNARMSAEQPRQIEVRRYVPEPMRYVPEQEASLQDRIAMAANEHRNGSSSSSAHADEPATPVQGRRVL